MSPDDPRHGEYAGYLAHRTSSTPICDPCREEKRRHERRTKKMRRNGWIARVPVSKTRRHILTLHHTHGLPWTVIADRAGVSHSTVIRVAGLDRDTTIIRTTTALALLAVAPDPSAAVVEAWRVQRRLRALIALGWPGSVIARRMGWIPANLTHLVNGTWRQRAHVSVETFTAVDRVFRDLCMTIPARDAHTTRARNRASAAGWVPPLAWDDIDDLGEEPTRDTLRRRRTDVDHAAVERLLDGDRIDCTIAEKREVTRRWRARGLPLADLERRLGWKVDRYSKPTDHLQEAS